MQTTDIGIGTRRVFVFLFKLCSIRSVNTYSGHCFGFIRVSVTVRCRRLSRRRRSHKNEYFHLFIHKNALKFCPGIHTDAHSETTRWFAFFFEGEKVHGKRVNSMSIRMFGGKCKKKRVLIWFGQKNKNWRSYSTQCEGNSKQKTLYTNTVPFTKLHTFDANQFALELFFSFLLLFVLFHRFELNSIALLSIQLFFSTSYCIQYLNKKKTSIRWLLLLLL